VEEQQKHWERLEQKLEKMTPPEQLALGETRRIPLRFASGAWRWESYSSCTCCPEEKHNLPTC
jgi:hypothetical protein